ncbi:hypothetical protein D9Q98_010149 [Chlorella vulgaris]|uniref:Uncharacterized protein n=1 Tax=Chlorella vulgaris TaxID=3077 RepID=A0A9D4TMS3_CHLVU|nr:hypothetical protein D9Q98_010149 [Chlorella vulgaris]
MSGRGEEDGGNAGELSMSFEETNKMRLSLGLKPLKMEAEELRGPSKEQVAAKEEGERAAKAAELAARVKQTRERRQQQEALDREKKLSAAGADVDDVMAWVSKSRLTEAQRKTDATAARRKTAQDARQRAAREEEAEDEEEEDEEMPSAAELAGAKVKHNAEDLEDGETMILTLEDRGILDDKGNLVDDDQDMVLENILAREDKQRSKAFKASAKQAKPLWEEDGKRRGLLDKYDEEEEQMMRIDDAGAVEAARQKRQDDIRARLAAGAAGGGGGGGGTVAQDASEAVQQQAADYYTQEEMAKFQKPKKKKERKLKKKALTAEELEALEAEAAARGTSDLGSRATRQRRADAKEATATAAAAERRARYEHALNKANYASLALRPDSAAGEDDGAAQEDDDLYQSLNKARLRAQKSAAAEPAAKGPESLAADLIKRREEQQRAATAARSAAPVADTGLVFTDVAEFTRTIHMKEEEEEESAGAVVPPAKQQQRQQQEQPGTVSVKKEDGEENYGLGDAMDTDQPAAAAAAGDNVWAGWQPASATGGESSAAEMKQKLRARQQQEGQASAREGLEERLKQEAQEDTDNVTREKAIGSGLAGALAFLKDRGDLEAPVEWSGRTNDSKKVNIQGLDDVYTGGRQEDRLAQGVEMALTRKDEYGRILTPKEAFRQLCYRFHGIQPSKNSREKRAKKAAEEVAKKKLASDVGATSGSASLAHMKQVQKQAATPYVVLSGTIKPGQSRDATSGYATVDRAEQLTAAPPVLSKLPGGNTPLLGNAKVEAMLGIKRKAGDESMPPPPPRAAKR